MGDADSPIAGQPKTSGVRYCEQNKRLLNEFAETITALTALHEQQFIAVVNGDSDFSRFDVLIHLATEKKQQAKYAYLHHIETHGC